MVVAMMLMLMLMRGRRRGRVPRARRRLRRRGGQGHLDVHAVFGIISVRASSVGSRRD